jgi:hypothetical protein
MLKLTAPRNSVTESPLWLYLFGLASVGLLVFAFVHLYASSVHQPRRLTSTEFAQPYIGEKYFYLADLADANGVIIGRTFEDCWIYGPAVISVTGGPGLELTSFEHNSFMAPGAGSLLIDWDKPLIASGVIKVSGCKFKRCHFLDVSLMGPSDVLNQIRRGEHGNITDGKN